VRQQPRSGPACPTVSDRDGSAPGKAPPTDAATVAVVTPTYDEVGNLERHVRGVLALGPAYRLVVVDDASPDGTGRLADALAREFPGRITAVHRPTKGGLAGAYACGIAVALAQEAGVVATMDADGSHRPADLAALVAALDDADVALGSRYRAGGSTPGWRPSRRVLSRFGGGYAAAVLRLPVSDATSGFRAMRRTTAAAAIAEPFRAVGFGVNLEMTWRAARRGGRIAEVPIAFAERASGASKLSPAIVLEGAVLVWRLRFADRRG
jgi:dolichol-phosphate mannosyltransferase